MKYRLDIFKLLDSISNGDSTLIDNLSEEDLKGFSPYVIQLWIDGADNNNDIRTVLTNEICNPYVFSLQEHKKLLYKLFCVSNGFGVRTNFNFKKKTKIESHNNSINVIMEYYNYSREEAHDVLVLFSEDDILEFAEKLGYESNVMKKIKGEFK